jgi:hypothetical protein
MATAGPPAPGWYADPLGSAGARWWDGAAWAGPVSVPQPSGRRLPGWAKTCFAVGIGLAVTNLAFISLMLFIVVFSWAAIAQSVRLGICGCAPLSLSR